MNFIYLNWSIISFIFIWLKKMSAFSFLITAIVFTPDVWTFSFYTEAVTLKLKRLPL